MEVSVNNEIRERENMRYKAIFFDWDGTAVESREAPADKVTGLMRQLLASGVVMVIISGTTYDKIADGKLERYFTEKELANLYLGLGRGACNYSFKNGEPVLQEDSILGLEDKLKIHKGVFRIHQYLLEKYSLNSDIVFTRPNYCKLDLMAEHCRNGRLYLQDGEVEMLKELLKEHGIHGGLSEVMEIAKKAGDFGDMRIQITTDAKYLEIGPTTKSDNVDYFVDNVLNPRKIEIEDSCFWGDEFSYLADGIPGSDSYMITEKTQKGHFFDVSKTSGELPGKIRPMGGGTETFIQFLKEQLSEKN